MKLKYVDFSAIKNILWMLNSSCSWLICDQTFFNFFLNLHTLSGLRESQNESAWRWLREKNLTGCRISLNKTVKRICRRSSTHCSCSFTNLKVWFRYSCCCLRWRDAKIPVKLHRVSTSLSSSYIDLHVSVRKFKKNTFPFKATPPPSNRFSSFSLVVGLFA